MRGLRSTIALAIVLVGLGAYIYFVTWKKPANDTGEAKPKVFASLESDKIDQIQVKGSAGETTTLKKTDGKWSIVEPVSAGADDQQVFAMASNLSTLEATRVVDEHPGDLGEYGLTTPRIDVGFKTAADKDFRHLLIGDKSPTGTDVFAKRADDQKVVLVPVTSETTFDLTTFQLRDKTLVKFDRDKVDGIHLAAGGKTVDLSKSGGDWTLTTPLKSSADFGSVEALIGRLQTAQMKSIASNDPAPAELKKFGLDKPAQTATLLLGSAKATLELGGAADGSSVYARDPSRPMVVTVDKSLADELSKGPNDLRRKDIFDFRAFNATHIELTRNGQTIVLDRVKGQKDTADTWHRSSPNAKDMDKDPMDGLLSKLSMVRAESFVDSTANTGLNAPVLVVDVKFDDGKKQERVTFGKSGDTTYASRADMPGAAKIDTADFTETLKAVDEIAK